MAKGTLAVTGDPESDHLVNTDPLALLIGMLLDQQVPMEWAFKGPKRLADRLGGSLDAHGIAVADPDAFAALVKEKPALHRFPGSMAGRIQSLCSHIDEHYNADAAAIWRGVRDPEVIHQRLLDLPGYGDEKARIFIAILAKRFGKQPAGWEVSAGAFADQQPRSVADIDSPEALARVREWKKAQKAAGKSKSD